MQFITLLVNNSVPVILALVTGGVGVALVKYYQTRPESVARARELNVNTDGAIIKYYKDYLIDLEVRLKKMEEKYDFLAKTIHIKDIETSKLLIKKDEEIAQLKKRVFDLETELKLYKKI